MTEMIVTLNDKLKIIELSNNTFKDDKYSDLYIANNNVANFITLLEQTDIITELKNRQLGLQPQPIKNTVLKNYVRLRKH